MPPSVRHIGDATDWFEVLFHDEVSLAAREVGSDPGFRIKRGMLRTVLGVQAEPHRDVLVRLANEHCDCCEISWRGFSDLHAGALLIGEGG